MAVVPSLASLWFGQKNAGTDDQRFDPAFLFPQVGKCAPLHLSPLCAPITSLSEVSVIACRIDSRHSNITLVPLLYWCFFPGIIVTLFKPSVPVPPPSPNSQESRNLLEDLRKASPPGGSFRPGVSRYNSVLKTLRNAPARDRRTTAVAPAPPLGGETTPAGGGGSRVDGDLVDLEAAGGRWSGAEGWAEGHVSGLLEDMRAAGVTPDRDTYQCAIRCATDAALLDMAKAEKAAAVEAVGKGGTVARGSDEGASNRVVVGGIAPAGVGEE